MNGLRQIDEMDDEHSPQSEITLGTATLLAIFFGLVLICAVFFGLGYSLGRRSTQSATPVADANTAGNTDFGGFKPSPGGTASQYASKVTSDKSRSGSDNQATSDNDSAASRTEPPPTPKEVRLAVEQAPATSTVKQKLQPLAQTGPSADNTAGMASGRPGPAHASATLPAAVPSNGAFMVQIAAVSHPEDADVLVKALRKHGHNVTALQDPTDHLIHVQLGPFSNRKDAEAVRQTLLTEGYNAIVK